MDGLEDKGRERPGERPPAMQLGENHPPCWVQTCQCGGLKVICASVHDPSPTCCKKGSLMNSLGALHELGWSDLSLSLGPEKEGLVLFMSSSEKEL